MMRNLQGPYALPQQYDAAAYGHYPPQLAMFPAGVYMSGPPASPRPPHQHLPPPGGQPAYYQAPYGPPQPQPMSRTSSAVSEQRPGSSIGQVPTPSMTPAVPHPHSGSQGTNSPAPASNFKIPARKSQVVIKDPESGAVKNFDKNSVSPAPASGAPLVVSSTSTTTPPPSLPPSRTAESQRTRSESKVVKTDEEKKNDMRDAIAKKIEADKAEEKRREEERERKVLEEKEAEERRLAQEKEAAERAEREAAEQVQRAKEEAEQAKARQEAEERAKKEAEERAEREAEEKARTDAAEKARHEEEAREERLRKERELRAKAEEEEEEEEEALASQRRSQQAAADELKAGAERERQRASATTETQPKKEEESDESADAVKPARENVASLSAGMSNISLGSGASTPTSDGLMGPPPKPSTLGKQHKPAALNLAPIKTDVVEPAQPSAALQSLRSARFIDQINNVTYPGAFQSPNPALNTAAAKGRFKYDRDFLMQFQTVFTERPSTDWENKLKDTVGGSGDSARPQSARSSSSMGPRNVTARAPVPNFSMGHFGQAGRTLAPGTTSEQRFNNANAQRQTMNNPLAQFAARPGGFPMGGGAPSMIRTNSSTSVQSQNAVPPSPRAPNRSQRNNSKRRDYDRGQSKMEEQASKTMPLTAGLDLKPLLPSTTGWKPRSVAAASSAMGAAGPPPGASTHMEPDMVQRKVKSNLNKMTPEKFDKISDQILEIAAQSKNESDGRTLRQVIQLTFEKATDEAHWASMYAKFCRRMLESMSPEIKDESIKDKNGNMVTGGNLFRKYLLNRCQEEFERGWKINLPPKPEGETEEAVMLSDDYYVAAAAKRRGLGLVQFIGELYKLGMLTGRIMHECVKKLVDYEGIPDEAEVESLTKLLRTIGANLEQTEVGKQMVDIYFGRIQSMVDTPELPSRLKFMLMVSFVSTLSSMPPR